MDEEEDMDGVEERRAWREGGGEYGGVGERVSTPQDKN